MDRVKRLLAAFRCAPVSASARAKQVAQICAHVDGVVVGSALVEVLERGEDVRTFLRSLREAWAVKRVFRAASLMQVAHARNVLLSAGIPSELRNQYLAGALGDLPMLETWPQLFVEDADEPAALRALARAAAAPTGASWTCDSCGEAARTAIHHLLALRNCKCIGISRARSGSAARQ